MCLTIREEKDGGEKKHAPHSTLTGPQVSSKVTNLIREILANYCETRGPGAGLLKPDMTLS